MNKDYLLITGASGFLGSKILNKLVCEGYNVVALVRINSRLNRIQKIQGSFELFYVNKDQSNLTELFENFKIHTIIHTATDYGRNSSTSSVLMSNLIFPIQLIEYGLPRGLKHFLNSDSFFGKAEFENYNYLNQYTSSKKYFYNYLSSVSSELKIINLRLEHIFGEFDSESKFVTEILHKLLKQEKEILLTEGKQTRDFIYVDDVVDAYFKVIVNINSISNLTEFEVGRGESISIRSFVELMAILCRSNSKLEFGAISNRANEIQNSTANIKLLKSIGWKSNFDLQTAIKKILIEENKINL
jgi:nucleoside-diphosphate-sugar epimerase